MEELQVLYRILEILEVMSTFFQIFFYGIILLIIIYFGYWFFSRFFY